MSFSRSPFSGFPFDRSCNRDESLRSTLDDLAKRHPELAEHLDTFTHHRGGSPRAQRLADDDDDADFDGRFEGAFREPFGGGFPFGGRDRPRADEFVRRFREPRRASGDSPGTSRPEHAPPPEDTAPEGADRTDSVNPGQSESASKPRSTIQQSNTIDLGQRQEAVDDRNQRSMSAPPTEKGQRYTSSINIPVNQPAADMADPEHRPHAAAPAAQEAAKPVERIIPIQIEGRDEPVVPRKAAAAAASFSQPPPRAEKIFGQRPEQFTQYLNREHFPDMWRGFPPEEPPPARRQEEQPKPPSPPPPPPENKTLAAIEQIQVIQKDVSALMEQAQKFDGQPRDKHYLYLDEMLTRNLIKLDNIDTQGQDMIRSSRKEAIKCIEKAIGILETKAALNAEGGEQKAPAAEEEKPAAAASEGGEAEAAPPEAATAEESTTDFVLVTEEKEKPAEEDSSKEETAEEKND